MSLELQKEAAPANPVAGYQRFFVDTTQLCPANLDEFGFKTFIPRVMGVTTTSVSSTTTAETKSLVGTIVGTFTVPANEMVIGRTFRMRVHGFYTTGGTASTITFFLKYAGTTIASTGAIAPTISITNGYWDAECDIICRTIGGSGTFFCQGKVRWQLATGTNAGTVWPIRGNSADPPAVVTVDTTVSSLIDFQITTGNNLHTVTCNMVTLEAML